MYCQNCGQQQPDNTTDIRDLNGKEIALLLRYRMLSDEDKAELRKRMDEMKSETSIKQLK